MAEQDIPPQALIGSEFNRRVWEAITGAVDGYHVQTKEPRVLPVVAWNDLDPRAREVFAGFMSAEMTRILNAYGAASILHELNRP